MRNSTQLLLTVFLIPYVCFTTYMVSLGLGYVVYDKFGYNMTSTEPRVCSQYPENYYIMCPLAGFGLITAAGIVLTYVICIGYMIDQKLFGIWDITSWMIDLRKANIYKSAGFIKQTNTYE